MTDMTSDVAFRRALPPIDRNARFPGFKQGTRAFCTGTIFHSGAMALPNDIEMRESTSMVLKDGTKLYCDIFLPADRDKEKTLAALIAWLV
jgi:uncharacterized protein